MQLYAAVFASTAECVVCSTGCAVAGAVITNTQIVEHYNAGVLSNAVISGGVALGCKQESRKTAKQLP